MRKVLYRDKQDIENSEEKTDKLNEMRTDTYIFMYAGSYFFLQKSANVRNIIYKLSTSAQV